jgi:hypothetical protein
VATNAFKLIKDFGSLATNPTDYLKQMYMSADGDVFAWLHMSVRTGQSEVYGYLVWKKSTNTVLAHTADSYIGGINEVHVDKSGKWLTIHLNQMQPDGTRQRVLNLATGQITALMWNGKDRPAGHGDLGTEMIAGFDSWEAGINVHNFNNYHQVTTFFHFRDNNGKSQWVDDFHGSMLADDENWITIGTYVDPAVAAVLPDRQVFNDELMQVQIRYDGVENFRRIAHTRSSIDNLTSTTGYWAMPKPSISRDGRFIAYTSNWEKSGRYDMFIARIEPASSVSSHPPSQTQRPRRVRPN